MRSGLYAYKNTEIINNTRLTRAISNNLKHSSFYSKHTIQTSFSSPSYYSLKVYNPLEN